MANTVAIGIQNFEKMIEKKCFYVDKTAFIKEWWESQDDVTLITRPRRFGKTLNMSMLECFFSVKYADRGELFEGLSIWEDEEYRKLQGTYPVISLSFANVKETNFENTRHIINQLISGIYSNSLYLLDSPNLEEHEKKYIKRIAEQETDLPDTILTMSLHRLAELLFKHYGKKVIILLDEYDTPMQEAYVCGYWEELVHFTRSLFNSTFKTNPYLERAVMTGITRVSKESIFSDLNNPEVVTTTSNKYTTAFGFTEEEVFTALETYGYGDQRNEVKYWYDGFVFGKQRDIYNPWSIVQFLDKGKFDIYWANTSSNSLVSTLIQKGSKTIKASFEALLKGETIFCSIDEQIVFHQLDRSEGAVFSLLLASGYLKALSKENMETKVDSGRPKYELAITNHEIKCMIEYMVHDWFEETEEEYNEFVKALLSGDIEAMNEYMNLVAEELFSSFDTGKKPSRRQPERFYHGFVLGLIVELAGKYTVTSNRESGFGRYDVVIEPKDKKEDAIILEFKVFNANKEKSLEETVQSALAQIEEKKYEADLIARGFGKEQIRKYGFAFEGKHVLIGEQSICFTEKALDGKSRE